MSKRVWAALAAAVVMGIVLRWPVLYTGLRADDFVQRAMLQGHFTLSRPIWDLFWFGGASTAEEQALMDFGYHPWWSLPGLRLSMFRPLSSLLTAFDVRVLGSVQLAHVHSFGWWLLVMLAAALLFGRLLAPTTAAVAVLLFALEEAHGVPLSWLANRSTLVSVGLGTLGLWAHLRARRDDWRPGVYLAPTCFFLGLAAGEYAMTTMGFLLSYELLASDRPWPQRLRAAGPSLAMAPLYMGVRTALGYGVNGSGFYISPSAEPLSFASAAALRVPVLSADLAVGMPASWWINGSPWRQMLLRAQLFTPDTWRRLPGWHLWHWLIGLTSLLILAALLHWAKKRQPDAYRELRWLGLGALLSLIPAAGSLPSVRLLVAGAIFISALTAVILVHAAGRIGERLGSGRPLSALGWAGVLALVAFIQVAQAAERSRGHASGFAHRSHTTNNWALAAEIPRQTPDLRLLLVQAGDFTTVANLPWVRGYAGMAMPRYYRRLSGAHRAHDVVRTADNTLVVSPLSGNLGEAAAGTLYRSSSATFQVGHKVVLPDMRVEVLRVVDGNPARIRFTFGHSLDDPRYLLLHPTPQGIKQIPMPAVGDKVRLPRAAFPRALR